MSRFLNTAFQSLEAYTPGEQPQDRGYIKLNTNESPFPPSPGVRAALTGEADALRLYPDPEGTRLRIALAKYYGVDAENVFLGNGSDEILAFAFLGFCQDGAAFPDITYGFYQVYAALFGVDAKIIPVAENLSVQPQDYCHLGRSVILANPNAPTGLAISPEEVAEIARTNPDHLVLIDEAYVDFGAASCIPLTKQYPNLLVVQTYSKSRSMAGARLGFCIGDAGLIADLNRLKYSFNPYNINRLTLLAGETALAEQDYYDANARTIQENRAEAAAGLAALGFTVLPSLTNFLFVRHPAVSGRALYDALRQRGILVRRWDSPRIQEYLRITVGTAEEMGALVRALADILSEKEAQGSAHK